MNSAKIFVKGVEVPKNILDQIWSFATSSYLRHEFTDDCDLAHEINLRLEFLLSELKISASRITQTPSILIYPRTSDFVVYRAALHTQIARLKHNFGLDERVIQKAPNLLLSNAKSGETAPSSVNQKMIYFKEVLGLTLADINKTPQLFQYSIEDNGTPNCLPYKKRYFQQKLGFSEHQFHRAPTIFTLDCTENSGSPTSVQSKLKFLASQAQIGEKQVRKVPLLLNLDCDPDSRSPSALINKLQILQNEYGILPRTWQAHPELLLMNCDPASISPTSLCKKIEFFETELGFSAEQFNSFPNILGMDCSRESDNPTAIINKVKFYQDLGLTKEDLRHFPNLLGYDCDPNSTAETSIISKLKVIDQLNIGREILCKMPILFGIPSSKIKIRYLLYKISPLAETGLKAEIFIQNEAKTYARLQYLNNIHYTANKRAVIFPETKFNKIFGHSSDELMHLYPLNEPAIHQLEHLYNSKYRDDVQLDQPEISATHSR